MSTVSQPGLALGLLLGLMLLPPLVGGGEAAAPVAAGAKPPENPFTIQAVLQRVPPLKHDLAGAWPLLTWEPFREKQGDGAFERGEALSAPLCRELLRRGLTPAVRLNLRYLPMALALQKAGCPVIIMEGWGGDGPGVDGKDTRHQLPKDFEIPQGERVYGCPMLTGGWLKHQALIRQTLEQFRAAGVRVNAVWLDWEVEPLTWTMERWQQARNCSRCQKLFPSGVLRTPFTYKEFVVPLRQGLLSDFVAAPILEVYPQASVSNWDTYLSTKANPVWNWWGDTFPPLQPGRFNASMPAVYGSNAIFTTFWHGFWGAPFRHLRHSGFIGKPPAVTDRVYLQVMLAAVSADAANRVAAAEKAADAGPAARKKNANGNPPARDGVNPDATPATPGGAWQPAWQPASVPWVSRYVQDDARTDTPVLSRERYREILRHVWLRGAQAMQVFNPFNANHPDFILQEVEDAVVVYDEMLEFAAFIAAGTPMNTEIPGRQETGVIWSGLRVGDRAVVRAFTQGDEAQTLSFRPWADGPKVKLEAPPAGATYLLERNHDKVTVKPLVPEERAKP